MAEDAPTNLRTRRWIDPVITLVMLYLLIIWAAWPEGGSIRHPIHHDDYYALSRRWHDLSWDFVRPVPWALFAAINHFIPSLAHIALALLVAGSVWLAIRFVEVVALGNERLSTRETVAVGLLVFGLPASLDYSQYLGLITNISSALLGLTAMCLMAHAWRRPERHKRYLSICWACAFACGFAKEDFALPVLLVAAGIAALERRGIWIANLIITGALSAVGIVHSRILGSPFVSGSNASDSPYFINFSLGSLIDVAIAYARASAYLPYVAAALVIAVLCMTVSRSCRSAGLMLAGLTVVAASPLAPYLLLPNHVFGFYTFYPAILAMASAVVGLRVIGQSLTWSPRTRSLASAACAASALLVVVAYQPQRTAVALWYSEQSEYNAELTRFCRQNARLLIERDVAIYGVNGCSPWHIDSAEYLYRRFGIGARWHLIVPDPQAAGRESAGPGWSTSIHARTAPPESIRSPGCVHVVVAPDGTASVAESFDHALALSEPSPIVRFVHPDSISRDACIAGFAISLSGSGFVEQMRLEVGGKSLSLSVHRLGDIATCRVPPLEEWCGKGSLAATLRLSGREVHSFEIPIR